MPHHPVLLAIGLAISLLGLTGFGMAWLGGKRLRDYDSPQPH